MLLYHNIDHGYVLSGTWSSPAISGTRPPPATNFTLTSIDEYRALIFGGREGKYLQKVSDVYLIDFRLMVCVPTLMSVI